MPWKFRLAGDMTIITKDEDFPDRSVLDPNPPRIGTLNRSHGLSSHPIRLISNDAAARAADGKRDFNQITKGIPNTE